MVRDLEPGRLVWVRRMRWSSGSGRIGIAVKRMYLTYEPGLCRWQVLIDGGVKDISVKNLYPAVV